MRKKNGGDEGKAQNNGVHDIDNEKKAIHEISPADGEARHFKHVLSAFAAYYDYK